jgi:hypothetical protein
MLNIGSALKDEIVRLSRKETRPILKIAALRGIGKREAAARLEQLGAATKTAKPGS